MEVGLYRWLGEQGGSHRGNASYMGDCDGGRSCLSWCGEQWAFVCEMFGGLFSSRQLLGCHRLGPLKQGL